MLLNWFRNKKLNIADTPAYWLDYVALFKQRKWDRKQLIADTRFVVFDTETTGLDLKKDRILSIGALEVKNRQIALNQQFECLIQQTATGTQSSIIVHGLLINSVEKGFSEAEAMQAFVSYIKDAILVGHHIGFDLAMMNKTLQPLVGDYLKNKALDTARLAIRFEHFSQIYQVLPAQYSLDKLCERYQIRLSDRHTSAGDAFITAILFIKLLARLEERGVKTLGDLLVNL